MMKMKSIMMAMALIATASTIKAQTNSDRISVAVGSLYERGLDMTLSYEHETKYHNAWEYFANGYIKWDECQSCGHVCPDSFWRNDTAMRLPFSPRNSRISMVSKAFSII